MGDAPRICDVVAFDLDGTLVDTTALHVMATQAAVQEIFGDPAPADLITQSLGRPLPESMRVVSAGRGQELDLVQAFLRHYAAHESDGVQCFPDVLPALVALRAAGIRLALLSNKLRRWGLEEIARLGIASFFDPVVFMEDMPIPKPSGFALRPILQRLQVAPQRVLVIGDGAGDIACARAAGALSGAALWGTHDPAPLLAERPDYRFKQIHDALALLDIPHYQED
ncbi:MAG TPA: HAD-IA family hydrolase [Ktedonobacterales bacterium]|nr:HAD-IA family hydrolase [Ktedonobacterales bacterium]